MTGDFKGAAESPERVDDPQTETLRQEFMRQIEREDERDESEHLWGQRIRSIFNLGIIAMISIVIIVVGGAIISLGWHMLVPSRSWLEPDELKIVKEFLLSGAMVSLGMEYFRRYIKK